MEAWPDLERIPGGVYVRKRPLSENARSVIAKRYASYEGEDWRSICVRVSSRLAELHAANYATRQKQEDEDDGARQDLYHRTSQEFLHVMLNREFLPAGRTLRNCGTKAAKTKTVPNCIVLRIPDSMDGILQTLHEAGMLQKGGSGLGFSLAELRPAGSKTSTGAEASGPIGFLEMYNHAFRIIQQNNRNGANMAIMPVHHPDILEFVHAKAQEGAIRNFNVSVGVTDEFMQLVAAQQQARKKDPNVVLPQWQCTHNGRSYPVRRVIRDQYFAFKRAEPVDMSALDLFEEIVKYAHRNGEPGMVFLDTVNRTNPLPGLGPIAASNPCGEQFLHPNDVCNLGAINLESMAVLDPSRSGWRMNWGRLFRVATLATQMLDAVVDDTMVSVPAVQSMVHKYRRVGLGVMGLSRLMQLLELPYDSVEGRKFAGTVMESITHCARLASQAMAKVTGPFPGVEDASFEVKTMRVRNCALTTVAPCGTISMASDTTGGMEPDFALSIYYENVLGCTDGGGPRYSVTDIFVGKVRTHVRRESERRRILQYASKHGHLRGLEGVPKVLRQSFQTSSDISPDGHVLMQAAMQKHCDNAISKTCNFPHEATCDDIARAFQLAHISGCKGCTVYRDGSRNQQVLHAGQDTSPPGSDVQRRRNRKEQELRMQLDEEAESDYCINCKIPLVHAEGCKHCPRCDYSMCSI